MKHRVEITVKKPANQKGKRKPAPRPLIRTGDSPDVLSRRKAGGITVYDLGWLLNGTSLLHQRLNADKSSVTSMQVESAYDDLDNDILGGGSPFTRFKKFEKTNVVSNTVKVRFTMDAVDYEDYPENLTQWSGSTLKISADAAATLKLVLDLGHPLYRNFDPIDGGDKITNLPDVSAPSVTFQPSATMKIGLMPVIASQRLEVTSTPSGNNLILNRFISILPRASFPPDFPNDWGAGSFDQYTDICKSVPNARAFEDTAGFPPIPLSAFPGASYSIATGFPIGNNSPTDSLVAIVESNETFYFWQTF